MKSSMNSYECEPTRQTRTDKLGGNGIPSCIKEVHSKKHKPKHFDLPPQNCRTTTYMLSLRSKLQTITPITCLNEVSHLKSTMIDHVCVLFKRANVEFDPLSRSSLQYQTESARAKKPFSNWVRNQCRMNFKAFTAWHLITLTRHSTVRTSIHKERG